MDNLSVSRFRPCSRLLLVILRVQKTVGSSRTLKEVGPVLIKNSSIYKATIEENLSNDSSAI